MGIFYKVLLLFIYFAVYVDIEMIICQINQEHEISKTIDIDFKSEKVNISFVVYFYVKNSSQWIIKSLSSVVHQNYSHFRIVCINDASDDNTLQLIEDFIHKNKLQNKVAVIHNKSYLGKLKSLYSLMTVCKYEEVLIIIDDNSYLLHEHVLDILANAYQSSDVWLTIGSCAIRPKGFNIVRPGFSLDTLEKNKNFRKSCFFPSPYSFYSRLLRKIELKKILNKKISENIYQNAAEYFLLWELLEISSGHIKYIQDLLCELKIDAKRWLYKDYCIRCACNAQQ